MCKHRAVTLALAAYVWSATAHFVPPTNIGVPAGLLPDCPGIMKNATISSATLPQLQVIHYKSEKGQIVKRALSVTNAARILAKDKFIDFKNKKTVIYGVGFYDSSAFPTSSALAGSYVRRGYNVFTSETFTLLTQIYPKSVRLARTIGKKIGDFLAALTQQGLTADNLELVGMSLGAHVMAYAAKRFYVLTGTKPSRLVGLDPAGPCFRNMPPSYRFNASDAQHVVALHTNMDGFGIAEPLGEVDFYANGGEFQPGDIPAIPCLVVCSHLRAFFYWWQSIENPKKFIGMKCDSVQDARVANCYKSTDIEYLGIEAKFTKPGIYYLPTSNEFPYFRSKEGLKERNEVFTSLVRQINAGGSFEV